MVLRNTIIARLYSPWVTSTSNAQGTTCKVPVAISGWWDQKCRIKTGTVKIKYYSWFSSRQITRENQRRRRKFIASQGVGTTTYRQILCLNGVKHRSAQITHKTNDINQSDSVSGGMRRRGEISSESIGTAVALLKVDQKYTCCKFFPFTIRTSHIPFTCWNGMFLWLNKRGRTLNISIETIQIKVRFVYLTLSPHKVETWGIFTWPSYQVR